MKEEKKKPSSAYKQPNKKSRKEYRQPEQQTDKEKEYEFEEGYDQERDTRFDDSEEGEENEPGEGALDFEDVPHGKTSFIKSYGEWRAWAVFLLEARCCDHVNGIKVGGRLWVV